MTTTVEKILNLYFKEEKTPVLQFLKDLNETVCVPKFGKTFEQLIETEASELIETPGAMSVNNAYCRPGGMYLHGLETSYVFWKSYTRACADVPGFSIRADKEVEAFSKEGQTLSFVMLLCLVVIFHHAFIAGRKDQPAYEIKFLKDGSVSKTQPYKKLPEVYKLSCSEDIDSVPGIQQMLANMSSKVPDTVWSAAVLRSRFPTTLGTLFSDSLLTHCFLNIKGGYEPFPYIPGLSSSVFATLLHSADMLTMQLALENS